MEVLLIFGFVFLLIGLINYAIATSAESLPTIERGGCPPHKWNYVVEGKSGLVCQACGKVPHLETRDDV